MISQIKFPEKLSLKREREGRTCSQKQNRASHLCPHLKLLCKIWELVRKQSFLQGSGFTSYVLSLQGNSNYWFQSFLIDLLFIHPRYSLLYDEIKPSIKFQKFQNNLQAPDDWKFSHVHLAFGIVSLNIFRRRIHLALTKTKNSPMTYLRQINVT